MLTSQPQPESIRSRGTELFERPVASDTLLILIGSATGASQEDSAALDRLLEEQSSVSQRVGFNLVVRQADDDDQLHEWVAAEAPGCAGLIINLAGCRTFDIDKLLAGAQTPVIEVRAHNPFKDKDHCAPLRRTQGPIGMLYGLGVLSYLVAINSAASRIARSSS